MAHAGTGRPLTEQEDFTQRFAKLLQQAYGDYFNNRGYALFVPAKDDEADFSVEDVNFYVRGLRQHLKNTARLIMHAFFANGLILDESQVGTLAEIFLNPRMVGATFPIVNPVTVPDILKPSSETIVNIYNFKAYIYTYLTQALFDKLSAADQATYGDLSGWQRAVLIDIEASAKEAFKTAPVPTSAPSASKSGSGYHSGAKHFKDYRGPIFLDAPSVAPPPSIWCCSSSPHLVLNLAGVNITPPNNSDTTAKMAGGAGAVATAIVTGGGSGAAAGGAGVTLPSASSTGAIALAGADDGTGRARTTPPLTLTLPGGTTGFLAHRSGSSHGSGTPASRNGFLGGLLSPKFNRSATGGGGAAAPTRSPSSSPVSPAVAAGGGGVGVTVATRFVTAPPAAATPPASSSARGTPSAAGVGIGFRRRPPAALTPVAEARHASDQRLAAEGAVAASVHSSAVSAAVVDTAPPATPATTAFFGRTHLTTAPARAAHTTTHLSSHTSALGATAGSDEMDHVAATAATDGVASRVAAQHSTFGFRAAAEEVLASGDGASSLNFAMYTASGAGHTGSDEAHPTALPGAVNTTGSPPTTGRTLDFTAAGPGRR